MQKTTNLIYLDNASTTLVDEEVLKVYEQTHKDFFANPSSIHKSGQQAKYQLDRSREALLKIFNLYNHQVIYLSGATEANNLAIKGVAFRYKNRGNHLITSSYEHPSVLEAFRQLESQFGYQVTYLNPNSDGVITKEMMINAITDKTILVSIMYVNNEIGAVNPIEEIAEELKKYPKVLFHTDASQAFGKLNYKPDFSNVDLVTLSSHKIHGLVGSGVLLKKKNLELLPLSSGGGQEYNLRSGTEDLPNALATLKAIELADKHAKERYEHVSELANRLVSYLKSRPDLYELNLPKNVNPYIINFSTLTKKSSVVVEALSNNNILVSSVSACHSSKEKGSYVVKSLGKSDKISNNTVRVSLDYLNSMGEIEIFISTLEKIIGEIR